MVKFPFVVSGAIGSGRAHCPSVHCAVLAIVLRNPVPYCNLSMLLLDLQIYDCFAISMLITITYWYCCNRKSFKTSTYFVSCSSCFVRSPSLYYSTECWEWLTKLWFIFVVFWLLYAELISYLSLLSLKWNKSHRFIVINVLAEKKPR